MSKPIIMQEALQGYNIIEATFKDFRQLLRKYKRSSLNQLYFHELLEYVQFMLTDEVFSAHYDDIYVTIEKEMEKAGLNPQDFHTRVYEEINGEDCLWDY